MNSGKQIKKCFTRMQLIETTKYENVLISLHIKIFQLNRSKNIVIIYSSERRFNVLKLTYKDRIYKFIVLYFD